MRNDCKAPIPRNDQTTNCLSVFDHFVKLALKGLKDIPIPSLTVEQKKISEGKLTEKEIYESLTGIKNYKSPDNDGSTKEFSVLLHFLE